MTEEFKNTFSWSVSRDNTLRECPRMYFFSYYGHWGGWNRDADKRTRDIYVLKNLKNRYTWPGQVVHECIARSLQNLSRGIPVLKIEEILRITRTMMREDFRQSRSGRYRENPKTYAGLFEHEYSVDVTDEEWKATADGVDRCLTNFYGSDQYRALADLAPEHFLEIEEFAAFDFGDTKVRIKLDCVTREDDRIVVWDWKTGKREKDEGVSPQMACYALYAHDAYGVPVDRVVTRRFDLFRNRVFEDSVTQWSLDDIQTYIEGSIKDMQGLLKDREGNIADEVNFRKVERRKICLGCNFLKVCQPNI